MALTVHPENSPSRKMAEKAIEDALDGFANPKLKAFPGMYQSMFPVPGTTDCVPAYILPMRNRMGVNFVMPDWVRHNGLPKGSGFQAFPHDVMHLLENNVLQNTASPKWGKSLQALHDQGSEATTWRNGVLGRAGVLEGKTLIICAPGPSLKEKLPLIHAARKTDPNVVVMAMNRAVRGIAADYVLFIERWVPIEWRDEHVQALQKDATLITCPQVDFKAVRDWPNDKVYWGYFNMGPYSKDDRVKHLPSLDGMASTTAACAVRTGYELGAKKVLLCGMDFGCKAEAILDKAPIRPDHLTEFLENLKVLAGAVSDGRGKQDIVKDFANGIVEKHREIESEGWIPRWVSSMFYFDDTHIKDTPYIRDDRFKEWSQLRSMDGKMAVNTTSEFISYAEQLRTTCGCIESGSDCRIINASPEGLFNWRPMAFDEALAWEDPELAPKCRLTEVEEESAAIYAATLGD